MPAWRTRSWSWTTGRATTPRLRSASAFPEAKVLAKPPNEGLVAGRNDAYPLARGRLVLMLDADTEVMPGSIEALASVLDARPEVGLVGPKLVDTDGTLQLSCRRYPPLLIPFMRRGPYARLNPDPSSHRRHLMRTSTIRLTGRSCGSSAPPRCGGQTCPR